MTGGSLAEVHPEPGRPCLVRRVGGGYVKGIIDSIRHDGFVNVSFGRPSKIGAIITCQPHWSGRWSNRPQYIETFPEPKTGSSVAPRIGDSDYRGRDPSKWRIGRWYVDTVLFATDACTRSNKEYDRHYFVLAVSCIDPGKIVKMWIHWSWGGLTGGHFVPEQNNVTLARLARTLPK